MQVNPVKYYSSHSFDHPNNSLSGKQCPTCLMEFVPTESVVSHSDGGEMHPVHKECALEWFRKGNTTCLSGCSSSVDAHNLFDWKERIVIPMKQDALIGVAIGLEILIEIVGTVCLTVIKTISRALEGAKFAGYIYGQAAAYLQVIFFIGVFSRFFTAASLSPLDRLYIKLDSFLHKIDLIRGGILIASASAFALSIVKSYFILQRLDFSSLINSLFFSNRNFSIRRERPVTWTFARLAIVTVNLYLIYSRSQLPASSPARIATRAIASMLVGMMGGIVGGSIERNLIQARIFP